MYVQTIYMCVPVHPTDRKCDVEQGHNHHCARQCALVTTTFNIYICFHVQCTTVRIHVYMYYVSYPLFHNIMLWFERIMFSCICVQMVFH